MLRQQLRLLVASSTFALHWRYCSSTKLPVWQFGNYSSSSSRNVCVLEVTVLWQGMLLLCWRQQPLVDSFCPGV